MRIELGRINVAENLRSVPGVDNIATVKIEDLPEDERSSIKQLAHSIEKEGLIQPLTVKDLGDGKYQLVIGWRRFMALRSIGMRDAECSVLSTGALDWDLSMMQLVENVHRSDLPPMDIARMLEKIRVTTGISNQRKLAAIVHKTQPWVSAHLSLLRSDSAIQDSVESGDMGVGAAKVLMVLPKGEQGPAVNDAKEESLAAGKGRRVTVKGAKRQVSKSKDRKKGIQSVIRPVADREREQKQEVIMDFLAKEYGDLKVPEDVMIAIGRFWDYLFSKNRLYIEKDPIIKK